MKFTCPKCSTRYTLAEDKVPTAAALRFTCKKCGNVVRVVRKDGDALEAAAEGGAAAANGTAAASSPGGSAGAAGGASGGAAKPSAAGARPVVAATARPAGGAGATQDASGPGAVVDALPVQAPKQSTRVASLAEIRAMKQASASAAVPATAGRAGPSTRVISLAELKAVKQASALSSAQPAAPAPVGGGREWFVLVAGKQTGPLVSAEIEAMLSRREIDGRTYIWREGMPDWQRLAKLSPFAEMAATLSASASAGKADVAKTERAAAHEETRVASRDSSRDGAREGAREAAREVPQGPKPAVKEAPKPSPLPVEHSGGATVTMSAAQLREQLAKTRFVEEGEEVKIAPAARAAAPEEAPEPASPRQSQETGDDGAEAVLAPADPRAVTKRRAAANAPLAEPRVDPRAATKPGAAAAPFERTVVPTPTSSQESFPPAVAGSAAPTPGGRRPLPPADFSAFLLPGEPDNEGRGFSDSEFARDLSSADVEGADPLDANPFAESSEQPVDARSFAHRSRTAPGGGGDLEQNDSYHNAPPGEATRIFMQTAGIYRRRRKHKIAAVIAAVSFLCLAGVVWGDVAGVLTVPGMGAVYDATGFKDPNVDRAVERVESKLREPELSPEERAKLSQKLEGLRTEAATRQGRGKGPREGGAGVSAGGATSRPTSNGTSGGGSLSTGGAAGQGTAAGQGGATSGSLTQQERNLAADIFADDRKKETGIKLVNPSEIQTPNLPEGLTAEAITKVVNDNSRSMKLCLEEAYKKGEKPTGKMEMQITIAPDGSVLGAEVATAALRGSAIAGCTVKRVKNWKFPRFAGEAVTVVLPFVLSGGF